MSNDPMREDIEKGVTRLPEHLRPGMLRYLYEGIPTGGFLKACIENDLLGAVGHAGEGTGMPELRAITQFFYMSCPGASWGSPANRKAWCETGGLNGMVEL
jgi:hypothetical protein